MKEPVEAIPSEDSSEIISVYVYNIIVTPWEPSDPFAIGVKDELPHPEGDPLTGGVE
jgi:hypothetical protein